MSNANKKEPLKRKFISLKSKIKILDRLRKGEKVSYVAKSLNLNEATIRTIKKNEQKIRTAVAAGSPISANMTARSRAPIIEKMEKALSIWIDSNSKRQISLDGNVIKQKALQIYNHLKENGESSVNPEFVASKGWFERFKNRFLLHNARIQGESASADNKTAKRYTKKLKNIIEGSGYTSPQVINADETDLWWKRVNSENDSIDENSEVPNFTLKSIQKGIKLAERLETYFLDTDPSTERSTKFKRELQKCLAPYYEIYKNLSSESKQIQITDLLKRAEATQNLDAIEESSKDEDILQQGKHLCLVVFSSDEEEEN